MGAVPVRWNPRSLRGAFLKGMVAVLFGVLPGVAFAQGGPPLLTEDPGTPGDGRTELNIAFTVEKHRSETRYEAPLVDLNYGVGDRIQLKLEVPWLIAAGSSQATPSGLGNVLVGFKWRYLDENPSGVDASVYPQADFTTNPHARRSGLVPEGMELLLPAQVAKDLGIFTVNVEGGYLFREEAHESWIWGLALGRKLTEEIEILGEVYGESSKHFNNAEVVFNLGARIRLSKLNSILLSIGRGIRGEARGEPGFIGYLGLQFNF